jgi:inositol phosphorylceramide mannosyltransferase catalytic subunit
MVVKVDFNKSSPPFVLCTHWGTYVCIDETTGKMVHRPPKECPINLVFVETNSDIRIFHISNDGRSQSYRTYPSLKSWEIEQDESTGKTTIRDAGLFASAEQDGRITISRNECHPWEKFARVPLENAYLSKAVIGATIPKFRRGHSIPKIIHQTYMHNELPENLKNNTKKLRDNNRDYAYRLWVDNDIEDFIHDIYGYDILELYLKIDKSYGACRADLFRYLCVYKLGGVYLDIKSNASRKLSEIILPHDEYLISQWDNESNGKRPNFGNHPELSHIPGGEYEQWHIIASPGHPYLEQTIKTVLNNIKKYNASRSGVGKQGVLRLSGPIAYTTAISPIIDLYPHRFIKSEIDGLQFNAIGEHTKLFRSHYASLKTPIVV